MKKAKIILVNFFIGCLAFAMGIGWLTAYRYFVSNAYEQCGESSEISFDISDPNSVLPIDYKEDELSDPRADETNPAMFDPEGVYTPINELQKELADFKGFEIVNKNFEVNCDDHEFAEPIPPMGYAVAQKPVESPRDEWTLDSENYEADKNLYLTFEEFSADINKLNFQTKESEGIRYVFSGEFSVKGNFYTLDLDTIVINGTLIKYFNEKKTAESEASFTWNPDEMCHC